MSDGKGCVCMAWGPSECACGVDWTPQLVYDQKAEIEHQQDIIDRVALLRLDLEVENIRLREAIDAAKKEIADVDGTMKAWLILGKALQDKDNA